MKEKSSKFIAFAFPVESEISVKKWIDELWELHPKATHICYAYRLGIDKNQYRANDDGEPSGSAGKPILGQIDSKSVTNILVAVVRYFGGTK
jgi:putative IMPACT (imprinted ancient) family translation regulator